MCLDDLVHIYIHIWICIRREENHRAGQRGLTRKVVSSTRGGDSVGESVGEAPALGKCIVGIAASTTTEGEPSP